MYAGGGREGGSVIDSHFHTWQAHVGFEEDALQSDVILIQQPKDVAVHALGPVGRLLNAVVPWTKGHLRLHNGNQPIFLHTRSTNVVLADVKVLQILCK